MVAQHSWRRLTADGAPTSNGIDLMNGAGFTERFFTGVALGSWVWLLLFTDNSPSRGEPGAAPRACMHEQVLRFFFASHNWFYCVVPHLVWSGLLHLNTYTSIPL